MKNVLYCFHYMRVKLVIGISRGAKMRLALSAPNRLLLIPIQAITWSMHHKLK